MKRIIDLVLSFLGLLILSPVLLIFMFLVWVQDFRNPFYVAPRAGLKMKPFNMIKLRSMTINADKSGVTSTSASDKRITKVGHLIRKYKLDEFTQLINVFVGDMSLVGPRPQVLDHIHTEYSPLEMELLKVKPGITDISSIVFSDEGHILKDSSNVDLDYNQLIRPWKSRLGLIYADKNTIGLDFLLIFATILAIFSKEKALKIVNGLLINLKVNQSIIAVCKRENKLTPHLPPTTKDFYH